MREYDTIDEGREERRSAVERLASLVYGLLLAYVWFWVVILVIGIVAYAIGRIS